MASQDSSPGIYQHEVSAAGPSTSTTIFPYVARENSLVPVRRDARAQSTSRVGSKSSARKWPVAHKMAISIVLVSSFFVVWVTVCPTAYDALTDQFSKARLPHPSISQASPAS